MPLAARGYWHEASEALAVRGLPGGLGLGQEPSGSGVRIVAGIIASALWFRSVLHRLGISFRFARGA